MSTEYDPTASRAPQSFSWGRLIFEMKLRGVPAMIACHCEPKNYDASKPFLQLELLDTMKAMEKSPSMQRLKDALTERFGENLQIEVVVGSALKSPAALSSGKKINDQINALQQIMNDSVVNDMIEKWGAQIVVDTVDVTPSPSTSPRPG